MTARTLISLLPQLILLLTAFVLLGIDLVRGGDKRAQNRLPGVALGGLACTVATTVYLWRTTLPAPPHPLPGKMLLVDHFALFFQLIAITATALVIMLSAEYMRPRTPDPGEFYALLLIACLAITLVAAATDLLMIYVSLEMLSITSYILTGYFYEDIKSTEAGIKYFLFGATMSATMLYGMSLFYGVAHTTNLAAIAQGLSGPETSLRGLATPALIFLLAGFGFKIAAVPWHQWAPDAYEGAPTPITAFLSIGPKAAGFAVLLRTLLIALPHLYANWAIVLSSISIITMIVGNLLAIFQRDVKRMMAYSSIAHAGYMLIGVACWTQRNPAGPFDDLSGVFIYLLAYLFSNVGAFVVIVALEEATGSCRIEDYASLLSRSPLLAAAMLISMLSLAGIPGTGGFMGKLYVFGAAINVHAYALAVVGIITSVIAAFYYLNLLRYAFFQPPPEYVSSIPVSAGIKIALIVTSLLTLAIGLYAQPFLQLAQTTAHCF